MNTGHKASHASESFPFAPEVYRAAEPASRTSDFDDLRAELRNEVRALRAHVSRMNGTAELGRELAAMRATLEEMRPVAAPAKRNDRVAAFLRLRGIDGQAAVRMAAHAKESADPDLEGKLRSALADVVPLAPWVDDFEGRRIIALVGPSGVGKTTTVAKLAARARVNGKSVALVSCDGYRVGAVDQLERYADLLGATFHVARTAAELATVLEEETADVVFVDTSGRPPTAATPEAALAARRKKGAPVPVEVLLCVPASIRPADAARVFGVFASLTPTAMCVTKLDETSAPSGLVHGPFAARLPLAVMCAGPRVPEDVSPATYETFIAAFNIEESAK
jgi:flagellar biosynthesis protein FlhF